MKSILKSFSLLLAGIVIPSACDTGEDAPTQEIPDEEPVTACEYLFSLKNTSVIDPDREILGEGDDAGVFVIRSGAVLPMVSEVFVAEGGQS